VVVCSEEHLILVRQIRGRTPSVATGSRRRRAVALAAVLLAALSLASWRPAAADQSFDTFSYPVGENPKGIGISDCNGDGKLDLIVANQNSNDLTVLRGDGTGYFEFGNTITSVDPQPIAAVCADFTGDSQIDVAVLARSAARVTIYKKTANGFSVLGSIPVGFGSFAASIAAADLNGDHKVDLLVVDYRSSKLVLLTGTGSDTLPAVSTIPLPFQTATDTPVGVAIGDFNHDGHPDIVVASTRAPFVMVLLGDGVGFQPVQGALAFPFSDSRRPPRARAVATADLNGDGFSDIALLSTEGTITIYFANSGGGFDMQSEIVVSPSTAGLALEDVDGDSITDLVLTDEVSNSATLLRGTGPGQFASAGVFPNPTVVNPTNAVIPRTRVIEPEDSLTTTELVYLDPKQSAPALELLTADAPTGLTTTPLQVFPKGQKLQALQLLDVTNDTLADAIVMSQTQHGAKTDVLRSDALGALTLPVSVFDPGCTQPACLDKLFSDFLATQIAKKITTTLSGDLDGDGKTDLVVEDAKGKVVLLRDSDGQGHFREVRTIAQVNPKVAVVLGDFNSDDIPDLAAMRSSRDGGGLVVLLNDGLGNFTAAPLVTAVPPRRITTLLAADLDDNGFVDLAYAAKQKGFTVLYNEGFGPETSSAVTPTPKQPRSLAAADFDEDGRLDVLVGFGSQSAPLMFGGLEGRRFGTGRTTVTAKNVTQTTIADLNDDLHQDLVTCGGPSSAPTCDLQYGNGAGRFSATIPATLVAGDAHYIGRQIRGVAAGDLDNDGTVDYVGVSRRDHAVVVLFRNPSSSDVDRVVLTGGTRPRAVALGDVSGDGLPDIVVINELSADVSVFVNLGNRQFAATSLPLPSNGIPTALALGDLDNANRIDIVVTQNGVGFPNVVLLKNLGGGAFTTSTLSAGGAPRDVQLADLNGDKRLDIIVANSGLGSSSVTLLMSGNGGGYTATQLSPGGLQPSAVVAVDVNHDDHKDLVIVNKRVVLNQKVGNVAVFLNDGNGGFPGPPILHQRGREVPSAICAGDFDHDGDMDVAVAGGPTDDIMVLRGHGDGTWRRDERTFPVLQGARSLACVDVDDDEKTDIVFGVRRGGDIAALRSTL
jgi:hypothetical protein